MNNATIVRVREGVGDLRAVADDAIRWEATVAHQVRERTALDVLHNDERLAVVLADLVDGADAGYSVEAGIRLEQTDVAYTIPDENIYYDGSDAYDYFEMFPNVKLTYRLSGATRVIAAYNRRVDRPGEPELRIFPKYDDPELLKVGNPFLRPQFTDAVEVGVARAWTGGSVSTALYHRDITDAFFRVFAIDDSNPRYDIVNRIFENAGDSTQTGVELLLEQDIGDPWRLSGGVNWYRNDIDAFDTILLFPTRRPFALAASTDNTWDLTLNNQLRLPVRPGCSSKAAPTLQRARKPA